MNKLIEYLQNLLKAQASTQSVALGFAVGTLIALLPTPGFGIFIGLFLAILFKKINKIGIVAAFSVWNPLMVIPAYWVSYLLGDLVFQPDPNMKFDLEIATQVYHTSGKFLVGNFFIAVLTAILSYYAIFRLITLYKKKKSIKKTFNLFWLNQFYRVK